VRSRLLPALLLLSACGERFESVTPVGDDQPAPVAEERFLDRLHLDLTGRRPADGWVTDQLDRLRSEGDSATTRAAIVDDLLADEAFAELWVGELENGVFGGETLESRYDMACGILRVTDPICNDCPASSDPCAECTCEGIEYLEADRAVVRASAADLLAGATTAEIGRRFAASRALTYLQGAAATATVLFEQFCGRPPEADELRNASAISAGALLPGNPAGLLFHRHGTDHAELVDIIFESEVYREAQVAAVFQRYLGRRPDGAERAHFTAQLDDDDPDVRPVIRAVVSSREYFEQ
jgi:hypothetical protein